MRNGKVIAILFTAGVTIAWGCGQATTTSTAYDTTTNTGTFAQAEQTRTAPNGEHLYHYYPQSQVYYAPERNMYFWPMDNGEWEMGTNLPASFAIDSDSRVVIPLSTEKPYKVHASVLSMFPAQPTADFSSETGSF